MPTYRLCAPFARDSRLYDGPPLRTRTRNADAPRNRDHGGRACPSNSLLELPLSRVRGNGGKSARDRRPPFSHRTWPTKPKQALRTIGGKSVNSPSVVGLNGERRLREICLDEFSEILRGGKTFFKTFREEFLIYEAINAGRKLDRGQNSRIGVGASQAIIKWHETIDRPRHSSTSPITIGEK